MWYANLLSTGTYVLFAVVSLIMIMIAHSLRDKKKDEKRWNALSWWVILFPLIGLIAIVSMLMYVGFDTPRKELYFTTLGFVTIHFVLMMIEYFNRFVDNNGNAKGTYISALVLYSITFLVQIGLLFVSSNDNEDSLGF